MFSLTVEGRIEEKRYEASDTRVGSGDHLVVLITWSHVRVGHFSPPKSKVFGGAPRMELDPWPSPPTATRAHRTRKQLLWASYLHSFGLGQEAQLSVLRLEDALCSRLTVATSGATSRRPTASTPPPASHTSELHTVAPSPAPFPIAVATGNSSAAVLLDAPLAPRVDAPLAPRVDAPLPRHLNDDVGVGEGHQPTTPLIAPPPPPPAPSEESFHLHLAASTAEEETTVVGSDERVPTMARLPLATAQYSEYGGDVLHSPPDDTHAASTNVGGVEEDVAPDRGPCVQVDGPPLSASAPPGNTATNRGRDAVATVGVAALSPATSPLLVPVSSATPAKARHGRKSKSTPVQEASSQQRVEVPLPSGAASQMSNAAAPDAPVDRLVGFKSGREDADDGHPGGDHRRPAAMVQEVANDQPPPPQPQPQPMATAAAMAAGGDEEMIALSSMIHVLDLPPNVAAEVRRQEERMQPPLPPTSQGAASSSAGGVADATLHPPAVPPPRGGATSRGGASKGPRSTTRGGSSVPLAVTPPHPGFELPPPPSVPPRAAPGGYDTPAREPQGMAMTAEDSFVSAGTRGGRSGATSVRGGVRGGRGRASGSATPSLAAIAAAGFELPPSVPSGAEGGGPLPNTSPSGKRWK